MSAKGRTGKRAQDTRVPARFPLFHHATMLADATRLKAYRRALERTVGRTSQVVDLGSGTGILASYAARMTRGPVYAIEYFPELARMAGLILRRSRSSRVQVIQSRSFDVTLSAPVDVLVTETIGLLGPEENIVESCYDFRRRHPSLKTLIPATLSLWAQPIDSEEIERQCSALLGAYFMATTDGHDYGKVARELEETFCSEIHSARLDGAHAVRPPVLLCRYELGRTRSSGFRARLSARELGPASAIHLYFEAQLCEGVSLSTHFEEAPTHWMHSYIRRPPGRLSGLEVSYRPGAGQVDAAWL